MMASLAGCATTATTASPTPAQAIYALGGSLSTAEQIALPIEAIVPASVKAQIKSLDATAYNLIEPLVANANNVSADQLLAAQAAMQALTAYLVQNGVKS
jgi:hypothetical protein